MLGYTALLFLVFLSAKAMLALNRHVPALRHYRVPQARIRVLQLSPLLYILSLAAFVLPVSWLAWLAPLPFGLLLTAPGIWLGRNLSDRFDRVGMDNAAEAGRSAANIMWLGVAVVLFIGANLLIGQLLAAVGRSQ